MLINRAKVIILINIMLFSIFSKLYSQESLVLEDIGIEVKASGFYPMNKNEKNMLANAAEKLYEGEYEEENIDFSKIGTFIVNDNGQAIEFHKFPRSILAEKKELLFPTTDFIAKNAPVSLTVDKKERKDGKINGKYFVSQSYFLTQETLGSNEFEIIYIEFNEFLLYAAFTNFSHSEAISVIETIEPIVIKKSYKLDNEIEELINNEKFDEALTKIDLALENDSQNLTLYEKRLSINYLLGNHALLQSDIDTINSLDPENPLSHLIKGFLEFEKGEYKNAINYFNKGLVYIIEREDLFDYDMLNQVFLCLGDSYSGINIFDKAIESYKMVLETNTDDETTGIAYFKIAILYQVQNHPNTAIEFYNKALNLLPESYTEIKSNAYLNRGLCYNMTGDYNKAIADFDNALTKDPTLYEVYLNKALAYFLSSNNLKAIENADKYLKSQPIDKQEIGYAYYVKGAAKLMLDNHLEGCVDLKKAEEYQFPVPLLMKQECK